MKTLCVIINHNRKAYTNQLYRALKPYEKEGNYYLTVLDNGTPNKEEFSEYTEYTVEQNTYYGGALNLIFQLMLESPEYDSIMVLNNDIIVHPHKFVQSFRTAMFDNDYAVVSPTIIQPEEGQTQWRHMHTWGSSTPRSVRWVDFVCPLINRKVVEHIKQYSHTLQYGWGQDLYTGMVCEQMGWKLAVLDNMTIIHMSSQTYRDAKSDISISQYAVLAQQGMYQFFIDMNILDKLQEFRSYGEQYTFTSN